MVRHRTDESAMLPSSWGFPARRSGSEEESANDIIFRTVVASPKQGAGVCQRQGNRGFQGSVRKLAKRADGRVSEAQRTHGRSGLRATVARGLGGERSPERPPQQVRTRHGGYAAQSSSRSTKSIAAAFASLWDGNSSANSVPFTSSFVSYEPSATGVTVATIFTLPRTKTATSL